MADEWGATAPKTSNFVYRGKEVSVEYWNQYQDRPERIIITANGDKQVQQLIALLSEDLADACNDVWTQKTTTVKRYIDVETGEVKPREFLTASESDALVDQLTAMKAVLSGQGLGDEEIEALLDEQAVTSS